MIDKTKLKEELYEKFSSAYDINKDEVSSYKLIDAFGYANMTIHYSNYALAVFYKNREVDIFESDVKVEK